MLGWENKRGPNQAFTWRRIPQLIDWSCLMDAWGGVHIAYRQKHVVSGSKNIWCPVAEPPTQQSVHTVTPPPPKKKKPKKGRVAIPSKSKASGRVSLHGGAQVKIIYCKHYPMWNTKHNEKSSITWYNVINWYVPYDRMYRTPYISEQRAKLKLLEQSTSAIAPVEVALKHQLHYLLERRWHELIRKYFYLQTLLQPQRGGTRLNKEVSCLGITSAITRCT